MKTRSRSPPGVNVTCPLSCVSYQFLLEDSGFRGNLEVSTNLKKNISSFNHQAIEPEPLQVKPFGEVVGKYPIPFLQEVFRYAEVYDVERGPQDKGFIFDRRLGAINVWDWNKGAVYSTLYADWATGEVRLQEGIVKDAPNWTPEEATKFWNRTFANVRSNTPTLLFC